MKFRMLVLIWLVMFCIRFGNSFQGKDNLENFVGKRIKIVGKITSEPVLQARSQNFKMDRIDVRTSLYPQFEYGQSVKVVGSLEKRVINRWYSQFRLMYSDVEIVKSDSSNFIGFNFKKSIFLLRKKIEKLFNENLVEPEASLLAGIVLGIKRSLSREFWKNLQKTGTLHIIVASGYNITVVIGVVIKLLAGVLKRKHAVIVGIVMAIIYTIMAGGEAAIIRACIMGSLAYLGQIWGRESKSLRLLLIAIMTMLLFNPMLLFNVGFQLSAMATLGLILISPKLEELIDSFCDGFIGNFLKKNVVETTSAQIAVTPILLLTFGNLSVFAILVNSLILWIVPIIMNFGAILAVFGLIFGKSIVGFLLTKFLSVIAYLPLHWMVLVVEWFGKKDWISFNVTGLSWWWGVGYYIVLWWVFRWRGSKTRFRTLYEFKK